MRRFLAPPEQAAALAAVRNVRVAEEDLARVAGKSARWRWIRARLSRRPLWGWRGRSRSARQRRFEEAICKAIDNGEGVGDINSADVLSWWKSGDPLAKKEEEVVADALASRSGSRKHHWAPLEVKEWMCELIEYRARSGWTRVQCVRHAQWLCSDVFEDVREDTVRNWKELDKKRAKVGDARGRPKTLSALSLSLLTDVAHGLYEAGLLGSHCEWIWTFLVFCCAKLKANTACMNSLCVFVTRTRLGSQLFASPSLLVCPCVPFVLCWW